jgi:hypothetical protein
LKHKRRLLHYESKHEPLLSKTEFARRLTRNFLAATLVIGASLVGGMCGYHYLERMPWIDAFVNASMILSGMGPVTELKTFGGKLFAGCYALYSGLTVVLATGLILAPLLHRILHRFHVEDEQEQEQSPRDESR